MTNTPNEFPESQLGIEYQRYFAHNLANIFAHGEQEWLVLAPDTYGDDAAEVWAHDIFSRFRNGTLQAVDIEDLQSYAPTMLKEFFSLNEMPFTQDSI